MSLSISSLRLVWYSMIWTNPAIGFPSPRSVVSGQYADALPHRVKGVTQIVDEILGALDADRQPHQRRVDSQRRAGHRRVRHARRVLDERLDRPERFRQREQARGRDEL